MAVQVDEHNLLHNAASEINIVCIIQWFVVKNT